MCRIAEVQAVPVMGDHMPLPPTGSWVHTMYGGPCLVMYYSPDDWRAVVRDLGGLTRTIHMNWLFGLEPMSPDAIKPYAQSALLTYGFETIKANMLAN